MSERINETIKCPVCDSEKLESVFPEYSGTCITSDMKVLPEAKLSNKICTQCGLIFNGLGTRGWTDEFYRSSYELMSKSKARIESFAGDKPKSQALRTYEIFKEFITVPSQGRILEAGAGKGEFLGYFSEENPQWDVHAFEPSSAFDALAEQLPNGTVHHSSFQNYRENIHQAGTTFDVVVALGVLEHVENPLDMLNWANGLLKPEGVFYVRVPNFKSNPSDLFCADHLSKLTLPSLELLAAKSGFSVEFVKEAGVPIFVLLRKDQSVSAENVEEKVNTNRNIMLANQEIAKSALSAITNGYQNAREKDEGFAIFGLSSVGLFAPILEDLDPDHIEAYLDENKSVWGNQIHGVEVGSPELIKQKNIKHLALAISPAYFDIVKEKLSKYDVEIYS